MSSVDTISGGITFTPPISWKEIREKGERFILRSRESGADRLLWLVMTQESVEKDEGTLYVTKGTSFEVSNADELNARGLVAEVEDILKTFRLGPEGERVFEVGLVVYGEHPGKIWRVRTVNGEVVTEQARITWPDGTEVFRT